VDVRQHPPVRSLTTQYLLQAQAAAAAQAQAGHAPPGHAPPGHAPPGHAPAPAGCPVILAPFGLAGTLTGQWYRAVDVHTSRLLEEWKHFYPIDSKLSSREEPALPPAVEVIVGE